MIVAIVVIFSLHFPAFSQQTANNQPADSSRATESAALRYIPDDVVFAAAAQPARVLNSAGLRDFIESVQAQDVLAEILRGIERETGVSGDTVEEVGVFIDEETAEKIRTASQTGEKLRGLQMIGLAMHEFHDVHDSFPAQDGFGDWQGNLSWRVHLLPYLNHDDLYEQFRLDEPWDSQHNLTLVEQMPDVFLTEGVEDAGKTSLHVIGGEGAPFNEDHGPRIQEVIDGTSNTILVVIAGADKAEIWTKPGALQLKSSDPVSTLGSVGETFSAVFMDGSARFLPSDLPPDGLRALFQHQDATVAPAVEQNIHYGSVPAGFVRSSEPLDRKRILETALYGPDVRTRDIGGLEATTDRDLIYYMFPDDRTLLFGPESTLQRMLEKRKTGNAIRKQFESLFPAGDAAMVVDASQFGEGMQSAIAEFPMAGIAMSLREVHAALDLTGTSPNLLLMNAEMSAPSTAQQLNAVLTGGYQMMKVQAIGAASGDGSPLDDAAVDELITQLDAVSISARDRSVTLTLPRPKNGRQIVKTLSPAIEEVLKGVRQSLSAEREYAHRRSLIQIGLAFHNYHDMFDAFPTYNSSEFSPETDGKGLSWRVHLLRLLNHDELYNEFHLDEPWDSPHNKTLIERMPDIFRCTGVEKPGYTSMHVFVGEGVPVGGEKPVHIRDITDGTSNTILAVVAGPDTAEPWTKPSGLRFDPSAPGKVLGDIGETFLILLCDGSVRAVSRDIDETVLSNLIQHADNNPIPEYEFQ